MDLCFEEDEFVRMIFRWVVTLSNGQTVYQDDGRPGVEEPSAWKRLKSYCEKHHVHIVDFWLQFRSNRVYIGPREADGYFFTKAVWAVWGESETHHQCIVGPLIDGKIHAIKWEVPALINVGVEVREPDYTAPNLIFRKS